ncbi:tetratricopeptide repeat protein, partial [Deltaproteobacteria bacterium PRO3]|nr:tetratricopeptide repeat protein [Deltaproteobacteria bacterium PRO3]
RIAQELKYRFQMERVRAAAPPREDCDLWIGEADPAAAPWQDPKAPAILVLTAGPERAGELERALMEEGWRVSLLPVPPFTRGELEAFFRELSGLDKVPENFLARLWERSRGNPQLAVSLLEGLARPQRWVDAHGRWNLAAFAEADLDFESAPLDLAEIDSVLAALPAEDHAGRAELSLRRAEELLKTKRGEEAEAALCRAEAEAREVADLGRKLRLRAAIYERRGLQKINAHRHEEARACVERALALLEEGGGEDEARTIRAQNYRAWLLCQEGKLDAAIELFEAMQRRWATLPPAEQEKVRNQDLGSAYLMKGDAARAVGALREILPFYERVGDTQALMRVHYNLGEAYLLAKDYAAAIESFQRGSELMRLHRNFEFLLRAYNGLGKARHLRGEWEPALADYGRGLELANYLEDYPSAAALAQNIGSIQAERGDFAAARDNFELALKLLGKLPEKKAYEKYLEARALVELGDLFRREGRFAEAELHARDADRMAAREPSLGQFRFWTLLTRAEIARDEGDRVRLQDVLAELLPLADDEEKQARCAAIQEGMMKAPDEKKTAPEAGEGNSTRVERFDPEDSLLAAERRIGEERDPEALRRLIRELQGRLDRSEQELAQAREAAVESSVLRRFAEMDFLSRNKEMQELFRMVERVRDTDLSVVLHGESGTGKELLARSLHERSRRQRGPFIALNCAALPANLVEAELFGYKAGA